MHYKMRYRRARPSTHMPSLLPPFGPPRHAAFPSGHAFTSHLIVALLTTAAALKPRAAELSWLADRIGLMREYAGLHFGMDTEAGKVLATAVVGSAIKAGDHTQIDLLLTKLAEEWSEA